MSLEGRVALVTGGSRGIGKAVGREFGLEGMKVALVARGPEALEECARELAEETGAVFVVGAVGVEADEAAGVLAAGHHEGKCAGQERTAVQRIAQDVELAEASGVLSGIDEDESEEEL